MSEGNEQRFPKPGEAVVTIRAEGRPGAGGAELEHVLTMDCDWGPLEVTGYAEQVMEFAQLLGASGPKHGRELHLRLAGAALPPPPVYTEEERVGDVRGFYLEETPVETVIFGVFRARGRLSPAPTNRPGVAVRGVLHFEGWQVIGAARVEWPRFTAAPMLKLVPSSGPALEIAKEVLGFMERVRRDFTSAELCEELQRIRLRDITTDMYEPRGVSDSLTQARSGDYWRPPTTESAPPIQSSETPGTTESAPSGYCHCDGQRAIGIGKGCNRCGRPFVKPFVPPTINGNERAPGKSDRHSQRDSLWTKVVAKVNDSGLPPAVLYAELHTGHCKILIWDGKPSPSGATLGELQIEEFEAQAPIVWCFGLGPAIGWTTAKPYRSPSGFAVEAKFEPGSEEWARLLCGDAIPCIQVDVLEGEGMSLTKCRLKSISLIPRTEINQVKAYDPKSDPAPQKVILRELEHACAHCGTSTNRELIAIGHVYVHGCSVHWCCGRSVCDTTLGHTICPCIGERQPAVGGDHCAKCLLPFRAPKLGGAL